MTLASLFTYAAALFVAALIPGPGITALVARALGQGFRTSYPMAFGLILGDLFYLTAVILGLAWIAQSFGLVFLAIKYFGAAYLAYLAWKLWHAGMTINVSSERKPLDSLKCFLSGLTLTLGNPKTMLFYIGIVPVLLDLSTIDFAGYAVLVGTTCVVLIVVTIPYMLLAGKARDWLAKPEKMQMLNRTAAAFIGGAAAMIVARG
jgi:threonine/homoserine/homoserine lactone efflux protein